MINKTNRQIQFPIKRWNQLTAEQLQKVKQLQCGDYSSRILMQLDIFLFLAGLKFSEDGSEVINTFVHESGYTESEVYESIDTLEGFLNGDTVVLEPIDTDSNERYILSLETLHAYVVFYTEFMDKDHSLVSVPFESIKIGEHEYKMPDGFLINTTYQQYTNAQHYLEAYWSIMGNVEKLLQTVDGEQSVSADKVKQIEELADKAKEMQIGFCANMLTPYVNQGEQRYDDDGKPYTFIRKVAKFVAEDEEITKKDMQEAPVWLFPLLYQQLQDNLRQFKSKFPDLFRESENDPKRDALVAELGTINIIIEKGGYASASAVYDENVVFIFKRLDMMQEEAREMKAAMNKGKGKK